MEEIWKDVTGFEGLYLVSNLGRVKSFRASAKLGNPKEFILKPYLINSGYEVITLYGNGKKVKFQVHRLVATEFIQNPLGLPCVNHKDENKRNNRVDNLEWCTYEYNNNYGTAKIRAIETKAKKVVQKTLDGRFLAAYASPSVAASLLEIKRHNICDWCRSGYGGGYRWEYL